MKSNISLRKRVTITLPDKITATVNGSRMELQKNITIANLLTELELEVRLVAVEQNLVIVPKSRYAEQTISDGDKIEIVHFVGGG